MTITPTLKCSNSSKTFENDVSQELKNNNQETEIPIYFKRKENWGREIFSWIIPIGLLIVFWIFIMRRFSGGGGSQIFNIGKSKATLFDKDTKVNVTFKDVAGLEEAKIDRVEDWIADEKHEHGQRNRDAEDRNELVRSREGK